MVSAKVSALIEEARRELDAIEAPEVTLTEAEKLTLSEMEKVTLEYAKTIARRMNVQDNSFVIHFSPNAKYDFRLIPGQVVTIIFKYPIAANFNTLLRDALRKVPAHVTTLSVVRISTVQNDKKVFRQKFKEILDVMPEIAPLSQIDVTHTETITIRDRVSGLVEVVSYTDGKYNNALMTARVNLGRKIAQLQYDSDAEESALTNVAP